MRIEVKEIITDGINDIFVECQDLLNIKHGDITPEEHSELKKAEEIIFRIIKKQKNRNQ